VLLNGTAINGTPSSFLVNGQAYGVQYGNNAVTFAAVPEPALLGVGLLGIGMIGRRRRRA